MLCCLAGCSKAQSGWQCSAGSVVLDGARLFTGPFQLQLQHISYAVASSRRCATSGTCSCMQSSNCLFALPGPCRPLCRWCCRCLVFAVTALRDRARCVGCTCLDLRMDCPSGCMWTISLGVFRHSQQGQQYLSKLPRLSRKAQPSEQGAKMNTTVHIPLCMPC
jgi:hypothetical protein